MESRPGCLGLPRRGSISQDPVAAWSRLGYDRNNLEPRPAGRNVFRGEGTQNFTGQASGGETPRPRDSGSPSGPPAGPPDGSSSGPPSHPPSDDSGSSKGQPERAVTREPGEEETSQEESEGKSSSYEAPRGGGGITDKINIGETGVSFGHGGRHLEGTNLSPSEVNQAIANDVVTKHSGTGQFYKGRIVVKGTEIEYTSFCLKDGMIHIGTYYPVH